MLPGLAVLRKHLQELTKYAALNYVAVLKAVKKRNRRLMDACGDQVVTVAPFSVLQNQAFFTAAELQQIGSAAMALDPVCFMSCMSCLILYSQWSRHRYMDVCTKLVNLYISTRMVPRCAFWVQLSRFRAHVRSCKCSCFCFCQFNCLDGTHLRCTRRLPSSRMVGCRTRALHDIRQCLLGHLVRVGCGNIVVGAARTTASIGAP